MLCATWIWGIAKEHTFSILCLIRFDLKLCCLGSMFLSL
jgi:hypothetical protein